MPLRKQPANATKKFAREGNLSPVVITTLSKVINEQLKRPHKVVEVADQANRKQEDLCDSAAARGGKARDFLCSSPIICQEERRGEVATNSR